MRSCHPLGIALVLLGLSACTAELPEDPPLPSRTTAVFGTNLNLIADYSPELMSVDLFKMSAPFGSGTEEIWEDGRTLDLDAQGWVRSLQPGQVARTIMLSGDVRYPAGEYTVAHEGRGRVEYRYAGHTDVLEFDGAGEELVTLDPDGGGLSITIVETAAGDYLRNFRVIPPGGSCALDPTRACDARNPCGQGECIAFQPAGARPLFNPNFLSSLRGYGVLRFMDWMQTNGSKQRVWADRPLVDDATWSRRGVPVEIMVELANRTGMDPWFCMPHMADDAYVERFASYVRDHLDPARTIYVEYSNEVWNDLFEQAQYARNQGKRLGLGATDFEAQMRFYALRTTEVHKIWEFVFGGTQRLLRVSAAQAANPWVASVVLGTGDNAQHTDLLAIAPYFGTDLGDPSQVARVTAMSVDQLMAELDAVEMPRALGQVAAHARIARQHGVELAAYEGGQHLVGALPVIEDERLNALFDEANRDPRMKAIYARYLLGWRLNGGRLFTHFTSCAAPSNHGRWGAREWMDQPRTAAPKYDAIMDYIDANPRWW